MKEKRYKLRFLPLFADDLNGIADYIAGHLKNPMAADVFINDVQQTIRERLTCAEAFEQYHSAKERQIPILPHFCPQLHHFLCSDR
jgi:plasmid stabilization system protein ParE